MLASPWLCVAGALFSQAGCLSDWGDVEPNEPADNNPGGCFDADYTWLACCSPYWRGGNPICWDVHSRFTFSRCCLSRTAPPLAGRARRNVSLPRPPLLEASTTRMLQGQRHGCWYEGLSFNRCCLGGGKPCYTSLDLQQTCCRAHPEWDTRAHQDTVLEAIYSGGADASLRYFLANRNKYAGYSGALPQLIQIVAYMSSVEVGRRAKLEVLAQRTGDLQGNGSVVVVSIPVRVLDIGAGWYASNPGDMMMAVRMLKSWGGCSALVPDLEGPDWIQVEQNVQVYAFEPHPKTFASTEKYLNYMLTPEERRCVHLYQMAVSSQEGTVPLMGEANNASLAGHIFEDSSAQGPGIRAPTPEDSLAADSPEVQVQAVTVDAWAAREGIDFLDFVKIDCEGMDWQVVLGMEGLLRLHRVEAVALEISEKMSQSTWNIAIGVEEPPEDIRHMAAPTLLQITQWFDERGYEGFLIGSLTLTPISGVWWKDAYEVCSDPEKNFGRDGDGFAPCWVDAIFFSRRSPIVPILQKNHRPIVGKPLEHLCIKLPACRALYESGTITNGHFK